MTILKSIDSTIQSVVDTAAFAVMRRFGCGKGPIRLTLNIVLVVETLCEAALYSEPYQVVLAFLLLLFSEWDRRRDIEAEASGAMPIGDTLPSWPTKLVAAFIAVSGAALRPLVVVYALALLVLAYLRRTPSNPPPSRATSRQLATVGAV